MARKKRGAKKTASKRSGPLKNRIDIAWRNFILFLIIFIFSYIFYSVSSSDLLRNFFGILSITLGFLAFAFLITFIVLFILKKARK